MSIPGKKDELTLLKEIKKMFIGKKRHLARSSRINNIFLDIKKDKDIPGMLNSQVVTRHDLYGKY